MKGRSGSRPKNLPPEWTPLIRIPGKRRSGTKVPATGIQFAHVILRGRAVAAAPRGQVVRRAPRDPDLIPT